MEAWRGIEQVCVCCLATCVQPRPINYRSGLCLAVAAEIPERRLLAVSAFTGLGEAKGPDEASYTSLNET